MMINFSNLSSKIRFGARWLVATLLIVFSFAPVSAQTTATATSEPVPGAVAIDDNAAEIKVEIERLTDLSQSIKEKGEALSDLQRQLDAASDPNETERLQAEIETKQDALDSLKKQFERIATDDVELQEVPDVADEAFNWQAEMVEIAKPVLNSLSNLTERPRKIQTLNQGIQDQQLRLEAIDKATKALETLREEPLEKPVADRVDLLQEQWSQRHADTAQSLETLNYQLSVLRNQHVSTWTSVKNAFAEFVRGRGLTLLIAAMAITAVWAALRLFLFLYHVLRPNRSAQHVRRERLIKYSFGFITGVLSLFAAFAVFYLRNDLLLIAITTLALLMMVMGLRTALPRYVDEARLLLNMGPVRLGERAVFNGIPLRVESINMFSVLRNPDLQGAIRLPLGSLEGMISRQHGEESWFPCHPEDYLMLANGNFAQVIAQSHEFVTLRQRGSTVQVPTADFLASGFRNLSREGFVVIETFGIDYAHQSICLDVVPQRFHAALQLRIEQLGLEPFVTSLSVDFQTAATNSLDYLICLGGAGEAANLYFQFSRLIQQTCVDVCNQEGWGIPFTQVTVHSAGAD